MPPAPQRPMAQGPAKITPSVIQAAPTVYTAPPAPKRIDYKSQKQARMVMNLHTLDCPISQKAQNASFTDLPMPFCAHAHGKLGNCRKDLQIVISMPG